MPAVKLNKESREGWQEWAKENPKKALFLSLLGFDANRPEESSVEMLMGGPASAGMSVLRSPLGKGVRDALAGVTNRARDFMNRGINPPAPAYNLLARTEAALPGSLDVLRHRHGSLAQAIEEGATHPGYVRDIEALGAEVAGEPLENLPVVEYFDNAADLEGIAGFFKHRPQTDPSVLHYDPAGIRGMLAGTQPDTYIGVAHKEMKRALTQPEGQAMAWLKLMLTHEGQHAVTNLAPPGVQRDLINAVRKDPELFGRLMLGLGKAQPDTAAMALRGIPGGNLETLKLGLSELLAEAFSAPGARALLDDLPSGVRGNLMDTFAPFQDDLSRALNSIVPTSPVKRGHSVATYADPLKKGETLEDLLTEALKRVGR